MALVKIGAKMRYLNTLAVGDDCTLVYPLSKDRDGMVAGTLVTRTGPVDSRGPNGKNGPWVKLATPEGVRTFSFSKVDSCSVEEGSMTTERLARMACYVDRYDAICELED
jgi:hypothetical protein